MTSLFAAAKPPALLRTFMLTLALSGFAALPTAALAQDASSAEAPAAEEPAGPSTVVATVGGEIITEADLAFAAEEIGQDLSNIPQDQLRAVLLAQMIDLKLMAQAGKAAGLENDELYKLRLDYLTDRAMRRAYTRTAISETITPEEIKAEYDKQVAAVPAEDEVHARHILVSTEDDAKAIKASSMPVPISWRSPRKSRSSPMPPSPAATWAISRPPRW